MKKTVGIPTGQLSEANPRYYMVLARQGALVRKEIELESPEVFKLQFGDVVTCVDLSGRRARIIDPVEGWVSILSQNDEVIMEPTFPPSKSTQVRTMNRRFDKLKTQQAVGGSVSPVAAPHVHRTPLDTDEPIKSSEEPSPVTALRTKIVFKNPYGVKEEASVPTLTTLRPLSAPSKLVSPAPQVNLLDLGGEDETPPAQAPPADPFASLI